MNRYGSGDRIEHDCGPLEPERDLRKQLKPLACQRGFQAGEAGDVPTRLVEPRDDASCDRVGRAREDDRSSRTTPQFGTPQFGRLFSGAERVYYVRI